MARLPALEKVQEFSKNEVWEWIRDDLLMRRSEARDDLEFGSFDEMSDVMKLRGYAEALRYVINITGFIEENYDKLLKEEQED
jgi:hypothetical protein